MKYFLLFGVYALLLLVSGIFYDQTWHIVLGITIIGLILISTICYYKPDTALDYIFYVAKYIRSIYYFFEGLIKYPRLFFNRHFLWKRYIYRTKIFFLKSYELKNEKIITENYFKRLYVKPERHKNTEKDIEYIMQIKTARYHLIRGEVMDFEELYNTITGAIKGCSKYSREYGILLLQDMSYHFDVIQQCIIHMAQDTSGKIRETAILIIEDGYLTFTDRKEIYQTLANDKNKDVRSRVISAVSKEPKKYRTYCKQFLLQRQKEETDESIKNFITHYAMQNF